jgi:hypothetical protein
MSSISYCARVLPDGHLPIPAGAPVGVGDLVQVTLTPIPSDDDVDALRQSEYLFQHWCGAARGSGRGVAEHHDDELYGR